MEKDGIPYTGFLYAGPDDRRARASPKTLEFNCRMGDPETQPIMMRLKSDLFDVMMAATSGTLDQVELRMGPPHRAGRGDGGRAATRSTRARATRITRPAAAEAPDAVVFHAGTVAQGRRAS